VGKYQSEQVLVACFGEERLSAIRKAAKELRSLAPARGGAVETPDLLIFKPDHSEVRFAECKRQDTADKLNHRQVLGFILIGAALQCPIDLFVLRERGRSGGLNGLEFRYG
jgi:hypothetical protein